MTTKHTVEPSLKPGDFDYFCLYNDELGRHEAYCQAKVATTIMLPATLAGAAAPGGGGGSTADVPVHLAAGELISIEFSYKYSQQEVEDLAAASGLTRVRAYPDRQQQYDLHLLQRMA